MGGLVDMRLCELATSCVRKSGLARAGVWAHVREHTNNNNNILLYTTTSLLHYKVFPTQTVQDTRNCLFWYVKVSSGMQEFGIFQYLFLSTGMKQCFSTRPSSPLPVLSPGQRAALIDGTNLDGSPATPQHLRNVTKTVKVKIQDSSSDLRTIFENHPTLREFIQTSFSWLAADSPSPKRDSPRNQRKAAERKTKSGLPDIEDIESLDEVQIDPEKAFKNL